MRKPVIGVIGNRYLINETYPVRAGGELDCRSISKICGATPLIIPADPEFVDVEDILSICDGVVFTGGRANVHPSHYGDEETEAHGTFDHARDAITLPLIRKMVARGQPLLGICRGFQEIAVAMGMSLHPEIRELPGRMNHRMPPDGTLEEKFELRHKVRFAAGGTFHSLFGNQEVMTNTLHGQGIVGESDTIVIDGWAEDGTPEAIYIKGAKGFALGVQWHPEWNSQQDPVSFALFSAFGDAVQAWAQNRQ